MAKKKATKKVAKKVAKKVVKKVSKKKAKKSVQVKSQEIVIRVAPQAYVPTETDLAEPMSDGKKLTIPKTWVSDKQILQMVQKTPAAHRYQRPGKGGQKWDYVTGSYVEKVLNYVFGFLWDFTVVEHGEAHGVIWVHGKLTVKDGKGNEISKSQFGRKEVAFKKDTKIALDYGNDLKAATTDALKKCASMLGIASDIYGKENYKQETGTAPREEESQETHGHERVIQIESPVSTQSTAKPGQIMGPDGKYTYTCAKCDATITDAGAKFSEKLYGKRLCKEHAQEAAKKKK